MDGAKAPGPRPDGPAGRHLAVRSIRSPARPLMPSNSRRAAPETHRTATPPAVEDWATTCHRRHALHAW